MEKNELVLQIYRTYVMSYRQTMEFEKFKGIVESIIEEENGETLLVSHPRETIKAITMIERLFNSLELKAGRKNDYFIFPYFVEGIDGEKEYLPQINFNLSAFRKVVENTKEFFVESEISPSNEIKITVKHADGSLGEQQPQFFPKTRIEDHYKNFSDGYNQTIANKKVHPNDLLNRDYKLMASKTACKIAIRTVRRLKNNELVSAMMDIDQCGIQSTSVGFEAFYIDNVGKDLRALKNAFTTNKVNINKAKPIKRLKEELVL